MSRLRSGSNAPPPQLLPPPTCGYMIVPCKDGGSYMLPCRSDSIRLRQKLRSKNVNPHASSGESVCLTSGGGLTVNG